MKTPKSEIEKFAEFQRKLAREKKESMWKIVLGTILFLIFAIVIVIHSDINKTIIYVSVLLAIWILFFMERIMNMNMARLEKRLREKIKEERDYLDEILHDSELLRNMNFMSISVDLIPLNLRETAQYLRSQKDKTPDEIIEDRKHELKDMTIQLKCYYDCEEYTFWRYVRSWKWLKKIA
jgi:uncharacterized membrane protein YcjF (UPF0283 family)